jgi:hypothetical protein
MSIELPPLFQHALDRLSDEELMARGITRAEQRKRMEQRILRDREKSPEIGDDAPDLKLEVLKPEGKRSGEYLQISSLRGKFVGILFGSYSCPFFRKGAVRFIETAKILGDRVQFLCIYLDEAHTSDGIQLSVNRSEGIDYKKPNSYDERSTIAATCMRRFNFPFPMLLDSMANEADAKYFAFPVRLYLLNEEGRIAYKGGLGPHYLNVDEFEAAVRSVIST